MIEFRDTSAGLTPDQLTGFFVGWPQAPSPQTLLRILEGSFAVRIAVDADAERVVGFVNAISDGVLSAYIPLLEVLPQYQGRGIGSELVQRLLGALDGLYMVDLVCDPALQRFYRPLGFTPFSAMIRRDYAAQACK